jgi:hypothetical protein
MLRLTSPLDGTPRDEGQETRDCSDVDIDSLHERYLDPLFTYVGQRVPN